MGALSTQGRSISRSPLQHSVEQTTRRDTDDHHSEASAVAIQSARERGTDRAQGREVDRTFQSLLLSGQVAEGRALA